MHPKYGRVMEHHGYATRIYWSPQMLDYMQRNYPTTLNKDLADWLGVSVTTVIRKARQLGLRKAPEWMRQMSVERCHLANAANARKGNSGRFKKGVHHNPAGEFKKGHKETPEGREKRLAGLRRYNLTHPKEVAAARRKAWQSRRKGNEPRVVAEATANPEGAQAREPYQNFDEGGLPPESIEAPM